jgi:hypothetical protein
MSGCSFRAQTLIGTMALTLQGSPIVNSITSNDYVNLTSTK